MTFAGLSPLANHLWQSTLCAAAAWLLTLLLRDNRAAARYWIWLAASVKFAIPFSLLVSAGSHFGIRTDHVIGTPEFSLVMNEIGRPFVLATPAARLVDVPAASHNFSAIFFGVWLCGFSISAVSWFRWWHHMRTARRAARPLEMGLPIAVVSTPTRLEPGVFGVRKPVLMLPEGITERLTAAQLQAVLAHELCHVRRRDNLTAAIHMVVEAVFWFHPVMWFIRTRLIEERERACDEDVLSKAADPQIYAEGILNVCKLYLESPLICASGVTGADLKKRIAAIMAHRTARPLDWQRKSALIAAAVLALFVPIAIGVLCAPPSHAQSQSVTPSADAFEVATIKPNRTGARNSGFKRFTGGVLNATNIPLRMLIAFAYDLPQDQIQEGPGWIDTDRYDILAKPDRSSDSGGAPATDLSMEMIRRRTRSLMVDRFKLTLRKETRQLPVYELLLASGGPKHLKEATEGTPDLVTNGHHVTCRRSSMAFFAKVFLTGQLGKPVLDKTGIAGEFDFAMDWAPDEVQPKHPGDAAEERNAADPLGPSLFAALQEQLGLKLTATKGPVEILVVSHAEKPTEN
jgi:bla regulator protein BlaR1